MVMDLAQEPAIETETKLRTDPMIRKTALGLIAAAATLAAAMGATASTASAHYYGYGYKYFKPHYCKRVIVGYDYYGYPIWRCVKKYYRYGYGY